MNFDYYYGDESNQFAFYRIPRQLITGEAFKKLSTDAKLLYGLLLDRMGLSAKNGWYDDMGRVFIYYTLDEIQEDLNCGHEKAVRLLAELDTGKKGFGLIERVKQGQGRPTKIYVKRFTTRAIPPQPAAPQDIPRLPIFGSQDFGKAEVKSSEKQKSRLPVIGSADFRKSDTSYIESIVIHGQGPDWAEVLAVFAVHTAGKDTGVDVATLDQDRVDLLKAVFWDMTEITSKVETIDHPGGEDSEGWTESILHITITPKTADEMRAVYAFTDEQNSALTELLSDQAALASLAGSLTITSADLLEVIRALPADLDQARKEAVETALSLVGKVGYFWGGKSLVIGWDSRWGTLREVTAAGSSTTGTYRPYGLDCSGMMDWIFYNITGGEYILGRGGGATAQRSYCTPVSQADAQPGDLAFYPDDSHVGIVVGRREDGKLLICHCSSGQNNVVVTEFAASGFTTLGRPDIFQ